jgi:TPR repeat protein
MLGRYLRKGLAGPPDPAQAATWLRRARDLGVPDATHELAELEPPAPDNAVPYRAASD